MKCLDLEILGYDVRSHTGIVDRVLDEGHARLVGRAVELLRGLGWEVWPEVSYSRYGERGSFDLLAWHAGTSNLLVIEVKTELVSVGATMRKLDEKHRLAAVIARERFELLAKGVSLLLVLPRSSTAYRQLARHATVIDLVLPIRSAHARSWLRRPAGRVGAVLFVSDSSDVRVRRGRAGRIRVQKDRAERSERGVSSPTRP